jgi:6-phosphogluconolactonase (cycloisomerase 2 family)
VTFTPAVTIDYTTATASVALTVVPAVPPSTTFGHFVYTAGTPDGPSSTNLINGYSISGATGDLTAIPNTPFSAGDSVIVMAVHPSGNFVYAATTGSSGSHVAAFTVDSATGELTPVSGSPFAAGPSIVGYNGGVAPDQILALDPSGKFLYVGNGYAGYGSYQVHGFAVDAATGALTPISQAPVQGAALAMGPRGGYLYASGYSASEPTTVYSIDPTSGALTQVQETPGCGGLYMTIESSGRFLYATGALGGTSAGISASQIDPSTGMLTPLNGSPFSSSPSLDGLAIHPSGAFLYAVAGYPDSGNTPDFVEGYAIDAATGALTAMQSSPFQLPPLSNDYYHLYGVSVEPHGNYVYAIDANYGVVSYSVNRTTGELSLVSNSFTFQPAASVLTVGNQNLWDPGVIWPTPAAIDYGTTLSGTQLDASASVPGTFTYSPAAGDVLTSGPQTLTVTFVPNDTADFTTATASVNLTVEKATPAISWTTPPAIIYGTGLGSGQLNATSSVAGTFAYSPAAGTILGAGPQTLSVTFTPTDSANYKTATSTVTLTVNQATPAITWPTPTAITYGTALTSIQLDASSTVAGTLAYSPAPGIVLGAGPQTLTATFTPTDTTDYKTATASVTLTVNQATPTVNWSPPAAITYGAALSAGQLDATSSVAGTFAYSPATGTVLSAGLQTLSVTFTPTDLADYKTATAAVTLTVNPATPPITWTTPAAITYGTALSSTQLDASTGVAGTFTYSPAAGTVLSVGSQTLAVTFAPTDSVDYKTATATVTLTVNQATPTTSWQAPTTISYGTALGAAQLDATSSVVGTFAYSPAAGTVLSAGLQTLKATFT